MPLAKTIIVDKNTKVLVWEITETQQELETIFLSNNSTTRLSNMRSETHKKGFISVRHLLKELKYSDADLYYDSKGKPHLKDGKNISISHSFQYATIIISDKVIGIDIEKNRDKIKRISHKFIDKENQFLQKNNLIEQLTVLWAAKESLYKIYPNGGLLFIKHLPIEPFSLKDKETKGWIKKGPWNEPYRIIFEFIDDFSLVYAVPLH
ncbi:4'-phosphopantetheinyl transferase superfamily protein [Flavicella sp.]|uniref:4'-phosphopantetheinyl transferase family protein n=1 Tax=Flavicella sp. TaxID=2957742 RepID=UPI00301949C5